MLKMSQEGNMTLALRALRRDPNLRLREAARIYNVPRTTLRRRQNNVKPHHETTTKSRKLLDLEEEAIIQYIIDLDSRAFSPRLSGVEDMANRLLALRGGGRVGIKWSSNFIQQQPQLQTRLTRRINY